MEANISKFLAFIVPQLLAMSENQNPVELCGSVAIEPKRRAKDTYWWVAVHYPLSSEHANPKIPNYTEAEVP